MDNKYFSIEIDLRLAKPYDLKVDDTTLKYGQPFWLMRNLNKKLEGPYIINDCTDPYELAEWINNDMIFVPVKFFE